jgi:hypothetical protein
MNTGVIKSIIVTAVVTTALVTTTLNYFLQMMLENWDMFIVLNLFRKI